ncbi:hypothetical protein BGZ93_009776 [Podila epicladia]|nr:hypothetical protein BGZ93_009776 [Podila epicladia]
MSTETNQALQIGQPVEPENFLPEVDIASNYVLPPDMVPWSPTTNSLTVSEMHSQGDLTFTTSSISVFSEAGPSLFSGSAPHLRFGFPSSTILTQGMTLTSSLDCLHLHTAQMIAQALDGLSQPILNQEHLRIKTPPCDLPPSPPPSQGQTPVVRSQASRFPSPVATLPLGTPPVSVSSVPVVQLQRDFWMDWIETQETWFTEIHSPHALSVALAAILTAAPSRRPESVTRDISQFHFSGSSLFSGPDGPSSSSSRSSSQTPVKGMRVGASDGALYDEELAAQWAYRHYPIKSPVITLVDFDYDEYDDDDDDDGEDEYDIYELGTIEDENDSGCDIGNRNDINNGDQDGQGDYTHHGDDDDDDEGGDDAPQMSPVAQGKRRDKDRQSKQDRQPRRPKSCSGRDTEPYHFTCPICPKRFRKSLALNRHYEHHLSRPVQCLNCGRKLSRGDAMKRHVVSKRYSACLAFGWFAERDFLLGDFPETSSSSPSSSRLIAVQEEDASSITASEVTSKTASTRSSASKSSSSAYEATLSQLTERHPEDGSPVVYGEPGNWFTIRNGVRVQIEVHGPFRLRACFPEWYLPRTPRVPRSPHPTSPDPPTPQPQKRASKEQKEQEDKKKRRDERG